jgi:hypothetical protein
MRHKHAPNARAAHLLSLFLECKKLLVWKLREIDLLRHSSYARCELDAHVTNSFSLFQIAERREASSAFEKHCRSSTSHTHLIQYGTRATWRRDQRRRIEEKRRTLQYSCQVHANTTAISRILDCSIIRVILCWLSLRCSGKNQQKLKTLFASPHSICSTHNAMRNPLGTN